jgi:hypothetical protein
MAELKKGSRITGADRDKLGSQLVKNYEKGSSIRALAEETGRSYGWHCCIKRSAYRNWSSGRRRDRAAGPWMPGLSRFSDVPEGPCSPLSGMVRAPFAVMQQCPPPC